jgi:hypothetical protein
MNAAARATIHAGVAVLLVVVAVVTFVRLFAFDGPATAWRFVAGMRDEWWPGPAGRPGG